MIKISNFKILWHASRNLLLEKIENFEFWLFLQILGKMAITFAYELGKNCLIYQNVQRENPHPLAIGFTRLGFFYIFKIPNGTMKVGRFKFLPEIQIIFIFYFFGINNWFFYKDYYYLIIVVYVNIGLELKNNIMWHQNLARG